MTVTLGAAEVVQWKSNVTRAPLPPPAKLGARVFSSLSSADSRRAISLICLVDPYGRPPACYAKVIKSLSQPARRGNPPFTGRAYYRGVPKALSESPTSFITALLPVTEGGSR